MKLGSLFDGIGGWLIAARQNGVEPVWASEIETFPIEVTKYHFPRVLHLGDVKKINGAKVEPVDIVTSGSPCQNLSVAGNRKGLDGDESSLFYESTRIVHEMQRATNGMYPRFFVWENVPGAFSSNKGMDFLSVIKTLTETEVPIPESGRWANSGMVRSGRCDVAWRVLDAQYWGVAQRRKRIFLVADFGAVGIRKPEVFFEPESLPGTPPQGRTAGQGVAGAVAECFAIAGNTIERQSGSGGNGNGFQPDISYTLTAMDRHAVATPGICGVKTSSVGTQDDQFVLNDQGGKVMSVDNKAATLRAETHGNIPAVWQKVGALCARDHHGINTNSLGSGKYIPQALGSVRRLTPLECERLQGLPDGWTDIPHKSCSDSVRYKAIGNGMAQPCANYVLSVVKKMSEGDVYEDC